MKKTRFMCLILCLLLTVQAAFLPVYAEEEEEPTETVTEETVAETAEATESAPVPPEEPISGDASVVAGCRTVDAQKPIVTDDNLLKTAKAAFLYERNTGTLLYAKNPDEKMYPASLTKVMTCMLAIENLTDLSEVITVSESAISNMDPDGSTINLQAGEEISVENLLYGLMVPSANDAGAVLAERVAGSQEAFVDMMNARAAELGCTNTHFANAHGLHDDNHYTTARDLARIMLQAVSSETFRKFDATPFYTIPATNMSEPRDLYSNNFMISNDRIDTFYDERVTGGKTGFTTPAGRCLMCTAQDEDMSLLSIVLGAEEHVMDDGYTVDYYGNFEETSVLLKLGFENFTERQVTMEGQSLEQFPVTDGKNAVAVGPSSDLHTVLPGDYNINDLQVQCELTGSTLKAPVAQGEMIGSCRVWYQDICVGQTGLVSLSNSDYRILGSNIFSKSELQRENLGKILKTAGIVFLCLIGAMLLFSLITSIHNAVISARRRKHRKERRDAERRTRAPQQKPVHRAPASGQAPRRPAPHADNERKRR